MKVYVIFRGNELYGWTHSKDILKIFLKQRNKKYKWKKLEYSSKDDLSDNNCINYVIVPSSKMNKEVKLFTTLDELCDTEKCIHILFNKACSFKDYEDSNAVVNMFLLLKEKYLYALKLIGFEPAEVKGRCNEYPATDYDIESIIDDLYGLAWMINGKMVYDHRIPGAGYFTDNFHQSIYSLESFIKVLKDELRR